MSKRFLLCITRHNANYKEKFIRKYSGKCLNKSIFSSDFFQRSLPILKVPDLRSSVDKYLLSQTALLDDDEFAKTSKIANEFCTGQGIELQSTLVDYAHKRSNSSYIAKMLSDLYLNDRRPVVLTHNPAPVVRSTNLVYSMLRFYVLLKNKRLAPEIMYFNQKVANSKFFETCMKLTPQSWVTYLAYLFKAYPMDMSQFENMFGTTRLAGQTRDEIKVCRQSRHLLVMCKGQHYVFDLLNSFDDPISPTQLMSNLQLIYSQPRLNDVPDVSSITTQRRDDVCRFRQRLCELGNAENLNLIDSALFVLAMDDVAQTDMNALIKNTLAGPPECRWFDKSLTLIVNPSGCASINFERSWGDELTVTRLIDDIVEDSDSLPAASPDMLENAEHLPNPKVKRLEWLLDSFFESDALKSSRTSYNQRCDDLVLNVVESSDGLTKKLCEQANLCHDAMMQLSFQLAYDLLHDKPAATSESCNTLTFKHGRTETVRAATAQTRHFVKLFRIFGCDLTSYSSKPISHESVSLDQIHAALKDCSAQHQGLLAEASMGKGWDRHLFALRNLALQEFGSSSMPHIFTDPNYTKINEIILSTNKINTAGSIAGGYPAVSPDGYGLTYAVQNDCNNLVCTSWQSAPTARSSDFCDAFVRSTLELAQLAKLLIKKEQ